MAAPSPTGGGRRPPLSAVGFRDQAATSRSPFPGVAAESYVYADPDASLGKSRRFTETLAKLLVSRTQTKVDDTTQHAHLHVQRLYALLRGQAVTVNLCIEDLAAGVDICPF